MAVELKLLSSPIAEDDLKLLNSIKEEAEKFQQEINDELINSMNEKINNVISKYLPII